MVPSYVTMLSLPSLLQEDYKISYSELWLSCEKKGAVPEQGWKIHVACTIDDFEIAVRAVVNMLNTHSFSFKVPKNKHAVLALASGRYGATATGKIITIYPHDQNPTEIFKLCSDLSGQLNYSEFYRIQTDIQFANTPIFLRYGSFKHGSRYSDLGVSISDVVLPTGQIVEDVRAGGRYKPDGIQDLFFMKPKSEQVDDSPKLSVLMVSQPRLIARTFKTDIFAVQYDERQAAILKVAYDRGPVDPAQLTAMDRLANETSILERLTAFKWCPNVLNVVKTEKALCLVESKCSGRSVKAYLATTDRIGLKWLSNTVAILSRLARHMQSLHSLGVFWGDLSPNNIMIGADLSVSLIDFEMAGIIGTQKPITGVTAGYKPVKVAQYHRLEANGSVDVYAFGAITFYMATGIQPIFNELKDHTMKRYMDRLKRIAAEVCFNQTQLNLAFFGIDLIGNPNPDFLEIIDFLNRFEYGKPDHRQLSKREMTESAVRQFVEQENRQFLNVVTNRQRNSVLRSTKQSLRSGMLGVYLLAIKNYECFKSESAWQWLNDNAAHVVSENDSSGLFLVDRLKMLEICQWLISRGLKRIEAQLLNDQIINKLVEMPLKQMAVGQAFGLAGIGTELCHLETKSAKTKTLIKKIVGEIKTRRYLLADGTVMFDIGANNGFPAYEGTNDFAYGLAGVGYFLCQYFEWSGDRGVLKLLNDIYNSLWKQVKYSDAGIPWIPQNRRDDHVLPGLWCGINGVALFLLKYGTVIQDSSIFNNAIAMVRKSMNWVGSDNHDILSGLSGLIEISAQFADFPKDLTKTLMNRTVELAETRNELPWQQVGSYSDDIAAFFTGTAGTLNELTKQLLRSNDQCCELTNGLF